MKGNSRAHSIQLNQLRSEHQPITSSAIAILFFFNCAAIECQKVARALPGLDICYLITFIPSLIFVSVFRSSIRLIRSTRSRHPKCVGDCCGSSGYLVTTHKEGTPSSCSPVIWFSFAFTWCLVTILIVEYDVFSLQAPLCDNCCQQNDDKYSN